MKEDYIDFKKEFEDFKKELENSKPIFEDESIEFSDFDNLISNSNDNLNNQNNDFYHDFPKINLETDDILMNLTIKKDYSAIDDLETRKKEFINDLREFIEEFNSSDESIQFMKYYDK